MAIYNETTPILTITGSDNFGWSGLQSDLRIIAEMGCCALTTATCMVIQNVQQIKQVVNFPTELIQQQLVNVLDEYRPKSIKVGLIPTAEAVEVVAKQLVGYNNIVIAPGILSSNGTPLIQEDALAAIKHRLIPLATILVLRQVEAEQILGLKITTDEELLLAAQQLIEMGATYVMLRGGKMTEGRLTAVLASKDSNRFFSSYNIEGWQQHGVGGALSTAIATRLGMGDDVPTAIQNAHAYVHSRIVYAVQADSRKLRPADIYNTFMNFLSDNYQQAHDVTFYANRLHITTRYLSQITNDTVQKSPKQIIAEYLLQEAKQRLENSRLSVKEISDNLGFSTTARFCSFFKQQQLQTPSEYRLSVELLS